jgi:hypothetical protein
MNRGAAQLKGGQDQYCRLVLLPRPPADAPHRESRSPCGPVRHAHASHRVARDRTDRSERWRWSLAILPALSLSIAAAYLLRPRLTVRTASSTSSVRRSTRSCRAAAHLLMLSATLRANARHQRACRFIVRVLRHEFTAERLAEDSLVEMID